MRTSRHKPINVGVCQTAILRELVREGYAGSMPEFARLIGQPEKRTWYAIAGLTGKRWVIARGVNLDTESDTVYVMFPTPAGYRAFEKLLRAEASIR